MAKAAVKRDKSGHEICEHGIDKYRCKPCGGFGICAHNRQKRRCIKCNPLKFSQTIICDAKGRSEGANLTPEFVAKRIKLGCPAFARPFEQTADGNGRSPWTPSLDRFDPALPYDEQNVWVISWLANRIKSDAKPEELLQVTTWVQIAQHYQRTLTMTEFLGARSLLLSKFHKAVDEMKEEVSGNVKLYDLWCPGCDQVEYVRMSVHDRNHRERFCSNCGQQLPLGLIVEEDCGSKAKTS